MSMRMKHTLQGGVLSAAIVGSQFVTGLPTAHASEIKNITGNLGDLIWEDQNKNGRFDTGEPGIPHVKVELHNIYGDIVQSVETDEKGQYHFSSILNGTYYIKMNIPDEYTFYGSRYFGADGLTTYFSVAGDTNNNFDAGLQKNTPEILPTSIKITPKQAKVQVGESYQIHATIQPENATKKQVKYTSSAPEVATVNEKGKVTANAQGKAVITVESSNGITETSEVEVTASNTVPPAPKLTEISSNPIGYVPNGTTRNRVVNEKSVNFTFKDITGKTYPQYGLNLGANYEAQSGIPFSKFGEKGFQPTARESGAFTITMDKPTSNIRLLVGAVYTGEFVKVEAYKEGERVPVKLDFTQQLGNVNAKFFSNGTDTISTSSQAFNGTEGYGVNIGGNYYDKLIIYPNYTSWYLPIWIDNSNMSIQ
ncbi:SdrD B-like domain-containing protein [Bacillus toyonensis]|uniref:BIG2 domain-containing protein n=1 Tax=Bacillus toyonensis TaxID=155322 RepID=A0A2A8H9T1_9BACI|nr:SdrD B-like domain-containing protein [Bacillus toyonensis]PEP99004.1 hypothetical protein CN585_23945 [Bacillus toyonensis]